VSLYRQTEVKTWGDEKFRRLSPLPPSGQSLWLWLLTGPRTTNLPGLLAAGRAASAEELGWDQNDFDRCYAELEAAGMARADWRARLIWLPNAVRHNPPTNPSIVVAWRRQFDLLPECALKSQAEQHIVQFLEPKKGAAYVAAFARPSTSAPASPQPTDPTPHSEGHGVGHSGTDGVTHGVDHRAAHQDQEQDQDQEKETPRAREAAARPTLVAPRRLHCAWESAIGLDVPNDLHREFTRKLVSAGYGEASADATLFAWYRETETAWSQPDQVVGDGSYPFWRARFREKYGTTVRPAAAPKVAGLAGGGVAPRAPRPAWICRHEPYCGHRPACEIVTARDVREGRLALADVQPALADAVRELVEIHEELNAREAVQA